VSPARIVIPEQQLAAFCRRNQIHRLALFGSVLRDDFRPSSDVDVLVEFEPGARVGLMALGRMQRELSVVLGRRVDLVLRDGLKPRIRQSVLESSETVYAR
jgi:predicted nucleotidyltransferase